MARVAWVFNNYHWPVNPEKDSGWTSEEVMAEIVPLNNVGSSVQFGGTKSQRRKVSGWIWGPLSDEQLSTMRSWKAARTKATLRDHTGAAQRAILLSFEPEAIQDAQAWREGRQTWRYNAEFIAVK